MKTILKYIDIILNSAAGVYLYMTPELDPILKWIIIAGVVLSACISIFALGTMTLGWALMMRDVDAVDGYEPGGERAIQVYESTIGMLGGYTPMRLYVSFAASLMLMVGLMTQGWTALLVLEVIGSAVGYGFIHWVMNNVQRMYERAHGTI